MINNKNIKWYFDNMKSNNLIASYWCYDGYEEEKNHIKIMYVHKSGKRASYRFLKERVTQVIRELKLRSILD
jgi:hypothetical protein